MEKKYNDREEILKAAYEKGLEYEGVFKGCARCSAAVLQEVLPSAPQDKAYIKAATALSGGATSTRNANCGAFTGCGIMAGAVFGQDSLKEKSGKEMEAIRGVFQKFQDTYGSVLCKDIRPQVKGECTLVVARACRWAAEVYLDLLEEDPHDTESK